MKQSKRQTKKTSDSVFDRDTEKTAFSSDGLSASELKALHERLDALRAADEAAEPQEKEHRSFRALIAYAACDFGVNEIVVIDLVKRHFGVTDLNEITEDHREALVRFLENMDIKRFIN